MKKKLDIKKITEKVKAGKNLTQAEELRYLIEVLGHTEIEAKQIFYINKHNRPGRLQVD